MLYSYGMSKTRRPRKPPSRQFTAKPDDKARLCRLSELETRSLTDQFRVILREAYELRGLDFETGEPIKANQSA